MYVRRRKNQYRTARVTDSVAIVAVLCMSISFLAQLCKMTWLSNTVYTVSLLFIFVAFLLQQRITRELVVIFLLIIASSFARGIVRQLDYFIHTLIMICVVLCIDMASRISLSEKTKSFVEHCILVAVLILLAAYYLGDLKYSYFRHTRWIALNFSNPNAAAAWLCCLFVCLFGSGFSKKKRKQKVLYFGAALAILPIIYATDCRNALIASGVYILGVVVIRIFKINRLPKFFLVVIVTLPALVYFVYMYLLIPNYDVFADLLNISSTGKNLDARYGIWSVVERDFADCFLIGNYPQYYDEQMHNSLMTMYCRYGGLFTIMLCVIQYRTLKNIHDNVSIFAAWGWSAVLFTGCFEASIFVGIAGLYLVLILAPICAAPIEQYHEKIMLNGRWR